MSRAWTMVAPSVCRFGRVGNGLSMINYCAIARRAFEYEISSEIQKRTMYSPQIQSFYFVPSEGALETGASQVLTVNAEVCG